MEDRTIVCTEEEISAAGEERGRGKNSELGTLPRQGLVNPLSTWQSQLLRRALGKIKNDIRRPDLAFAVPHRRRVKVAVFTWRKNAALGVN